MLRARDNPFATHRVLRERYRLDEAGWRELRTRLCALNYRGAIVGPHGSGKTTLLEDLAATLARENWRVVFAQLTAEFPELPSGVRATDFGARDILMIDGAEQLSPLAWCWLRWRARRAGGLIITTHNDGRLPTIWRCATSPLLLTDLVVSLGERLADEEAAKLHARHDGNLRGALRELYDRWATSGVE